MQQTGTVLDISKLTSMCVSWGKILEKQHHDVTWTT